MKSKKPQTFGGEGESFDANKNEKKCEKRDYNVIPQLMISQHPPSHSNHKISQNHKITTIHQKPLKVMQLTSVHSQNHKTFKRQIPKSKTKNEEIKMNKEINKEHTTTGGITTVSFTPNQSQSK